MQQCTRQALIASQKYSDTFDFRGSRLFAVSFRNALSHLQDTTTLLIPPSFQSLSMHNLILGAEISEWGESQSS